MPVTDGYPKDYFTEDIRDFEKYTGPAERTARPPANPYEEDQLPPDYSPEFRPLQARPQLDVSNKRVRWRLARAITYALIAVYLLIIGAFLVSRFITLGMTAEDLTSVVAALSGLQALAAAIIGFYFGTKKGVGTKS